MVGKSRPAAISDHGGVQRDRCTHHNEKHHRDTDTHQLGEETVSTYSDEEDRDSTLDHAVDNLIGPRIEKRYHGMDGHSSRAHQGGAYEKTPD